MQILEAVRKAKSEKNVSIKYPLEMVEIISMTKLEESLSAALPSCEFDLKAAGNIRHLEWTSNAKTTHEIVTDDERFALRIEFADEAEVA
jgi:hypothetical protein